jgi:hypothetical protein
MHLRPSCSLIRCNKRFQSNVKRVVFQELRAIGGDILQPIPFVHAFYAFKFPLIYNHHNREGDVTIIPSTMGTRQGDPWGGGGVVFILTHFRA